MNKASEIRTGDTITYCGETFRVASVQWGEAAGIYMVTPEGGGYPRSIAGFREVKISRPRPVYTGPTTKDLWTGKSHFLNDWGEIFCGTDRMMTATRGHGRAECKVCQKAGDAALRDGTEMAGGSPARR